MYVSFRRYEGIAPNTVMEIVRLVEEGFVPIISQNPGFIAYYAVDVGGGVIASISMFKNEEGAVESNEQAAAWVLEHMAHLFPQPPQITAGEVIFEHTQDM